ncbi:hypothetical protein QP868_08300 [Brevibacterium sp. UMB1308A]|uniref:hypothetical protein n=1 Tax=Brevibacterium sp. UMB1308A TaxID=3050608 RepID=UPI0025514819|nr:hypothetical protein [Brevibacterium sp. UMB1308A]MDK8345237.1 hypothetical protein [Brevibacterium sp. UMB1308B]MDK8713901.1 hypothetical protein [Brevibacterium sp. UMB1308A]
MPTKLKIKIAKHPSPAATLAAKGIRPSMADAARDLRHQPTPAPPGRAPARLRSLNRRGACR